MAFSKPVQTESADASAVELATTFTTVTFAFWPCPFNYKVHACDYGNPAQIPSVGSEVGLLMMERSL